LLQEEEVAEEPSINDFRKLKEELKELRNDLKELRKEMQQVMQQLVMDIQDLAEEVRQMYLLLVASVTLNHRHFLVMDM